MPPLEIAMGFYLHIEIESPLSPDEFRERVVVPLGELLASEHLGRILEEVEGEEAPSAGTYQLALEVADQNRARELIQEFLKTV